MDFSCMSKEEIRRSYKEAKDKNLQIIVLCDLTLSTRKEMMDFLGIPNLMKNCIDQEQLEAEYRKLYDQGFSDAEIAERTNRTKGMVAHWRRKEGLPTKQAKGRKTSKRISEVRWHEVYMMGLTDKEAAEILGVSRETFRDFRMKYRLEANGERRRNCKV